MHHPTVIYLGRRWNVIASNDHTVCLRDPRTGEGATVKVEDVR